MILKTYENCTIDNPKNLVIFLHGYGANGQNLINLANEYKIALPKANFISPNAIQDWEGGFPNCYQWFSLYNDIDRRPITQIYSDIKEANIKLTSFIDEQLKRFNLSYSNLVLVGFSQGAMMAIYQALILKEQVRAVIAYSGRVIMPEMTNQATNSRPNICLIHGKEDSVVDFSNFEEGIEILRQNNIPCQYLGIDNLDHSIDIKGVKFAVNFLKNLNN
jgi:phospholipase/carboxylesterase